MVIYLNKEHLQPLFGYLQKRYARIEEVPDYENEKLGYEKLLGVLERVRMELYYPDLLDKATYLLIAINKGHFFSNGNKRLALVVATTFLTLNDTQLKEDSKEDYKSLLESLFPEYTNWTDFPEFTSTDFATYHLSIVIAESGALGIEHDDLKGRVKKFFERASN